MNADALIYNSPDLPTSVTGPQQQQSTVPQHIDTGMASGVAVPFLAAPGAEHTAHKLAQQQLAAQQQFYIHPQQQQQPSQQPQHNHQPQLDGTGKQNTLVLNYEDDFPTLPPGSQEPPFQRGAQNGNGSSGSIWSQSKTPATQPLKSSTVTQIVHLGFEERRYREPQDHHFGEKNQEQHQCNDIMQKTSTKIEISQNKDQSIAIVITGKRPNVEEARKLIVQNLQTQAYREIHILKDHHRVLIGKEGKRLQQLEKETDCRIMIPNRDVASDVIKIVGPREGIEKAVHSIQLVSDEQSKMAQEHLLIPKIYYPWIKGPFNETVDRLQQETGARINIPPPTASSDVIVVTGEKEGVYKAAAFIKAVFEEKKTAQTVSIQVSRTQHRYVVGSQRSGLMEILRETGISVEVPPEDAESDTITLRGDSEKLGQALAMVYSRASSVFTTEIQCPFWLHKFVKTHMRDNVIQTDRVTTKFETEDNIFIEGPPEDVKRVKDALSQVVNQLRQELAFEVLHISPTYHRHIIGKNGANIGRIKQETGVFVHIPSDETHSDEIRLEGKKEGVQQAKEEIMEIAKRLDNEKSRDIIIENRFHRILIGSKGEALRDVREKFPGVRIHFPEPGRKSDVVTLRGPKDEVDKCHKHLQSVVKELVETNYQVEVPVFKDFHRHIIGKGGANIKRIRDETETKIELPAETTSTDVIKIIGKKANADRAKEMIMKLQEELASIVTEVITIAQKTHSSLIGGGGRLIQSIADDCGNVQIKFPPEKPPSDKVTIRGPKDGVEKAKKLLLDLAKDRELAAYSAEVKAKPELFRFLIGRGGARIKKLREANPDVRIMFPRPNDTDQDIIHLIGRKEDVEKVKAQLEEIIRDLNQSVEIFMEVDSKHHRHFVARGASVLREIQEQYGGVSISFPKPNSGSTRVVLKGAKECAEGAKKRIQELVDDLEAQVTISVPILQRHHRSLLAGKGAKIQEICHACNVQIKFPERNTNQNQRDGSDNAASSPTENGKDEHEHSSPDSKSLDQVTVTGRAENCEKAKEMLLAEVPINETINVPYDYHRNLIGRGGSGIRKLMDEYNVSINVPQQDLQSNEIGISGSPANVRDAIAAIMERIDELDEDAKLRELKNFKVSIRVPTEYHPKLIGPKGSNITRLRTQFDVQITIPAAGGENAEEIVVTGLEDKAHACRDEIQRMVDHYTSLFTQEITLDARIHSRLIGQKGKTIRKIMDDYKVEIRFPRQQDPDPNLVLVSGRDEDSVYDCIDHLRNLEEEYMQDASDRNAHRDPKRVATEQGDQNKKDIEYVNAPWQQRREMAAGYSLNGLQEAPDVANMQEFPSMGLPEGNAFSSPTVSVWGAARRA